MNANPAPARLVVLILILLVSAESQAQITTNTALPVGKGEGILRLQTKFIHSTDDPSPMDRKLRVYAFVPVAVYGVTSRVTIFGIAPILDKNLDLDTPAGPATRTTSGPADARLFGRYTILQRNRAGQTMRLAPFGGVEIPTGTNDARDELGNLPAPLQLGSGSWDPFGGVVFSWQTFSWQIDASLKYTVNTTADDFEFGDEARLDVASKVRLLPRDLGGGLPNFLYGNLETNVIRADQNEMGEAENPDSGGTTWYVAPGFQYVTRRVIVETAVQLPLVQKLNGLALENDLIFTLSLRVAI